MFNQLQLRTFDYTLRNAKPIRVLMNDNVLQIDAMRFVGDGTELDLTGIVDMNARRVAGLARGTANLGILQGIYRNIRTSGTAQLTAQVSGSMDAPVILGRATVENGRLRYVSLPHSLDQVNGTILFDSRNIRLDGLSARLADGQVNFEAASAWRAIRPRILLYGFRTQLRLRYPEGVRSEVDADLSLTGRVTAPVLAGSVTVQRPSGRRGSTRAEICSISAADSQTGEHPSPQQRRRRAACRRCGSMCESSRRVRCASKTPMRRLSRARI